MLYCPICHKTKASKGAYSREYVGSVCDECDKPARNTKRLIALSGLLEEDALQVLVEFGERLLKGQSTYGELDIDTDDRDWLQEAFEEDLDSAVYRIINLIKLRKQADNGSNN
jgi:hypothetical protein